MSFSMYFLFNCPVLWSFMCTGHEHADENKEHVVDYSLLQNNFYVYFSLFSLLVLIYLHFHFLIYVTATRVGTEIINFKNNTKILRQGNMTAFHRILPIYWWTGAGFCSCAKAKWQKAKVRRLHISLQWRPLSTLFLIISTEQNNCGISQSHCVILDSVPQSKVTWHVGMDDTRRL